MNTEKTKKYVFRVEGSVEDIAILADAMVYLDGNKSYELRRNGEAVGEIPLKTMLGWWIDDGLSIEDIINRAEERRQEGL